MPAVGRYREPTTMSAPPQAPLSRSIPFRREGTVAVHAVYIDYGTIPITVDSPTPVGELDVASGSLATLENWTLAFDAASRRRPSTWWSTTA